MMGNRFTGRPCVTFRSYFTQTVIDPLVSLMTSFLRVCGRLGLIYSFRSVFVYLQVIDEERRSERLQPSAYSVHDALNTLQLVGAAGAHLPSVIEAF